MSVRSLAEMHTRDARVATVKTLTQAARAAIAGTLLTFPVACGLVALLLVSPSATIPDLSTLALTVVTSWAMLALFVTAVIATRSR